MSVFLRHFIENKKYIVISLISFIVMGFMFGLYFYHHSSGSVQNFLQCLFYLNVEGYDNCYQLYVIQNGLFIFICTYLSTSYLGFLGIFFLNFVKGIQFSFSVLFVCSHIHMSFVICILILCEVIIEILFCIIMNVICSHISFYVAYVTFLTEQNFNIKSMMNYHLNALIIGLSFFFIALAFRIYVIPMF